MRISCVHVAPSDSEQILLISDQRSYQSELWEFLDLFDPLPSFGTTRRRDWPVKPCRHESFLDVFVVSKCWLNADVPGDAKTREISKHFACGNCKWSALPQLGTARRATWRGPVWMFKESAATWWPYGWPPHGHLMFRGPGSGACPNAEFLDKELPPCIAVPILRALSAMTATRLLHPELRPFIGCGTRLWI